MSEAQPNASGLDLDLNLFPKLVQFFSLNAGRGQGGKKISADAIRLARREAVWELRCRGWTQERIANYLDLSQPTVSRDIRWAFNQHRERLLDSVDQVKAEHRATLEYMVQEALDAWIESKEEALEVSRKSLQAQVSTGSAQGQPQVKPVEQTTKVRGQTGDVAYIREARALMKEIRDIVGANAPTKVALTDPSGKKEAKPSVGTVIVIPSRMTLEEALTEPEGPDDSDADHPGD